jgi:hypothetical protein
MNAPYNPAVDELAPQAGDIKRVALLKIARLLHNAIFGGVPLNVTGISGGSDLPDQAGHGGEVLSTDGATLEWVAQGGAATIQVEAETLAALKALATTSRSAGDIVFTKFSGDGLGAMILTAGTNNDDNAGDHRPDDYNAATNIVYWHRSL